MDHGHAGGAWLVVRRTARPINAEPVKAEQSRNDTPQIKPGRTLSSIRSRCDNRLGYCK